MKTLSESQTLPLTHRAALFYAPTDVRYETMPMPQPGPGEMLLKMEAALTCGTDIKTFRRGHPVLMKQFPSPFGHEGAGRVVALGEGVSDFLLEQRVVAANSAPCRTCFFCRKHQPNLCENLDLLNGTYAEYMIVLAPIVRQNTLPIPDHVSFEAAAFTEPLAVSLRGFEACEIQPGDHVAVIGLGAIGQLMIRLAVLRGAHVVALGRNPLKRSLAKSFGKAHDVLDMTSLELPPSWLEKVTPAGHGFDVVIEAVGQPETWELAMALVRRGGRVNLFGGCTGGSTVTLNTQRLHYDEITLLSTFHHTPTYFQKALQLISDGEIDPTPLITHELPMDCVLHALELVAEGKALKVCLKPH